VERRRFISAEIWRLRAGGGGGGEDKDGSAGDDDEGGGGMLSTSITVAIVDVEPEAGSWKREWG
jgi:hypothetical protein